MYSLEDRRGYLAHKLGVGGIGGNFYILRTYYDIHFLVAAEALVYTRQFGTCHIHQTVVDHRSAEDIALTDKVCNESIGWFVVDIGRCTYLLYLSLAHHHDGIAQGEGFFLVVSYVYEGNAQAFVHLLQFQLHVFTHLEVECCKRFIQEKNFRFVDNGTGDGDTLLLTARKRVDITIFIITHVYHLQGTFYLRQNLFLRCALEFQTEGDIVVNVEMREQSVFLEYRVYISLVRRKVSNIVAGDGDDAFAGGFKPCQKSQ